MLMEAHGFYPSKSSPFSPPKGKELSRRIPDYCAQRTVRIRPLGQTQLTPLSGSNSNPV